MYKQKPVRVVIETNKHICILILHDTFFVHFYLFFIHSNSFFIKLYYTS